MSEIDMTPLIELNITKEIYHHFRVGIISQMNMCPYGFNTKHYRDNIYRVKIYPIDNLLFKTHRWLIKFAGRLVKYKSRLTRPIEILIMEEFYACKRWIEHEHNVILELED